MASRPASMTPDRNEVISSAGDGGSLELAPGVRFQPLVGKHIGARNLTTGLVTFDPGARLPFHTHTFTESLTLLSGGATLEAEERSYALQPLDNATIPPGLVHSVLNPSPTETTTLHIALATDSPSREFVEVSFECHPMPADANGPPGAERLSRSGTTTRYEPNPGAVFQDFFNRDLGCEEMSGGYGLFAPGAQLPCHIHDFDESISIVQGKATCVVEGKRYSLSDNATALVPRGRCHYFINDSDAPMAMVWVYAGPLPQRFIMATDLCDKSQS